jgi:hypothetical protein
MLTLAVAEVATSNVIESPRAVWRAARERHALARSGDGGALGRFGLLLNEKNFRKIDGHRDLWALVTILGRHLQFSNRKRRCRRMNWLLLPAFNYGWDTLRMDA